MYAACAIVAAAIDSALAKERRPRTVVGRTADGWRGDTGARTSAHFAATVPTYTARPGRRPCSQPASRDGLTDTAGRTVSV